MSKGDVSFIISASDKTKAAFVSVDKSLRSLSDKVFSVQGAIAGLAGAAGFGALIKMQADTVDQTAKVADRLGIATEKLSGLQYASDLAGVSGEKFNGYLANMSKNIGNAAAQGGSMASVIKMMGLDLNQLTNMRADQQFLTISDAISKMGNSAQRSYAESTLMSDSTGEMLNVMSSGRGTIEGLTKEAEDFGLALNRVDSAKVEAANDSLTRAGYAVKGVATTITVQLSPYIAAMANQFADASAKSNGFKDEIISGAESIANGVAYVADVWRGLEVVWKGLEVIFYGFEGAVLSGLEAVDHAVSKVVDAVPGLEAKPSADLAEWAEDTRQKVLSAETALHDLANKPMPSNGIKKFFADVRKEAETSAQSVSISAQKAQQAFTPTDKADNKALAAKFQQLQESLQTEEQAIYTSYYKRLKIIDDAERAGIGTQQERDDARFEAENRLQDKINAMLETKEQERQSIRDKFDKLQADSYDPAQVAAVKYAAEMEVIQINEDAKTVTLQEANAARLDAQQQYNMQLLEIENSAAAANMKLWHTTWAGKAQVMSGVLGSMSTLMQSHSKTQFEIGKKAAIANAIINTYSSATGAFQAMAAIPIIGPVLGAVAAAAAIASGMAQVSAIRSQQFGSGSTGVSVGSGGVAVGTSFNGGAPAAAPQLPTLAQQDAGPRVVNLTIQGDGVKSDSWVRDTLIPQINDAVGDGVELRATA